MNQKQEAFPSETRKGQLEALQYARKRLGPIFASLVMQYFILDCTELRLLYGETAAPNPKPLQLTASLFTLSSLLRYQKQSMCEKKQIALAGGRPDQTNEFLGMVVLCVAVIRFFRLLGSGTQEEERLLEEDPL